MALSPEALLRLAWLGSQPLRLWTTAVSVRRSVADSGTGRACHCRRMSARGTPPLTQCAVRFSAAASGSLTVGHRLDSPAATSPPPACSSRAGLSRTRSPRSSSSNAPIYSESHPHSSVGFGLHCVATALRTVATQRCSEAVQTARSNHSALPPCGHVCQAS